jgi:hypothetical protein
MLRRIRDGPERPACPDADDASSAGHTSPDAIIETGTFLGDTTRFFSGNLIPVYSIEVKLLFHLLARFRVGTYPDVTLIRGDSRRILEGLARRQSFNRPIAYLDAHWWDELPLETEVKRILDASDQSVIVIDDCQVAEDPGYGFHTFRGVPLSLNLLQLPSSVVCAFPATLSYQETGARRGALHRPRESGCPSDPSTGRARVSHCHKMNRQPNTIKPLLSSRVNSAQPIATALGDIPPLESKQGNRFANMGQDAVSSYGSSYGRDRQLVAISHCGLTTIR